MGILFYLTLAFLLCLKVPFLSLIFAILIIMTLGMDILGLILFGALCVSWT